MILLLLCLLKYPNLDKIEFFVIVRKKLTSFCSRSNWWFASTIFADFRCFNVLRSTSISGSESTDSKSTSSFLFLSFDVVSIFFPHCDSRNFSCDKDVVGTNLLGGSRVFPVSSAVLDFGWLREIVVDARESRCFCWTRFLRKLKSWLIEKFGNSKTCFWILEIKF